ncbi:hypothetical protein BKI52_20800 [marine bacterium AO1-C]|nr:hypothetical protein BKI52_20800 [marine bacterium AO1-C]
MKKLPNIRFTFVFIWLVLSGLSTVLAQNDQPKNKAQEIEKVLNLFHKQGKFNGTALIVEGGKVLYKGSFGFESAHTKKAINSRSAFYLASVTKQFTATAIVKLQELGKLSYDHSIARYLPKLKHYQAITIRHLLQHTSGISDYEGWYKALYGLKQEDKNADYAQLFEQKWKTKLLTNETIIEALRKYRPTLNFATGEKFEYSNTNYILLASIVERASGLSFDKFLKKYLFEPAGMRNAYVYHLKMKKSPKNRVYGFKTVNGLRKANDLMFMDGVIGDGNVYGSAEDLLKWDEALYTEKIIKNASKEKAFAPGILNNGQPTSYGFGWAIIKPQQKIMHLGQWTGFQSAFERDMQKHNTIILIDNSTSGSDFHACYGIVRAILAGRDYKMPQKYTEISLPVTILQQYVGKYAITPKMVLEITLKDKQLYAQGSNQPKLPIYPTTKQKFFYKVADMQISFIKNDQGKVHQMMLHQQGRKIPAKRITSK